ncbi:glycosyltransferase family 2 protein [Clostridium estertheticum]|uniref:glycosyltransferase family 2 protein n=1 Tax=Clostridium estertheticum TaxID=238834 RepID=UPI001CF5CFD3|nr:glycosyltransferase family 2 protein [Clostridium estertheticum]MCB2306041.1 glycosyltransferase family 2 protein [Clostridium estertheticum]MCB2346564.1 glycosyltransferase family 2 protein [Clostridium estertheticum]MCB2348988.1 glycosyltransferase family 2 protein [Clostridium estertheticum]WAG47629.1 glycosyltransferase family 2 protein [Clostridium estertheticum]
MSNVEFSVITVSYNNLQILIDCIESIYKFNDIGNKLEVIIVDNSPESDIFDYIKEKYIKVKIVKNDNRGFGEANNVGATFAKGKYLLFLNPDTILVEPIFKFAIDKFEQDKELGGFGVKLVDLKCNRNTSFQYIDKCGFIDNQIIKLCRKLDFFIDGKMCITGADIFMNKEVFYDCGMFDENIFMYSEEADLTRRIKSLKKKTAYFKERSIIHLEGKTISDKQIDLVRRMESQKYYCGKYGLNFKKMINSQIRYIYFKMIMYKITYSKKYELCKNNINIMKGFCKER